MATLTVSTLDKTLERLGKKKGLTVSSCDGFGDKYSDSYYVVFKERPEFYLILLFDNTNGEIQTACVEVNYKKDVEEWNEDIGDYEVTGQKDEQFWALNDDTASIVKALNIIAKGVKYAKPCKSCYGG